MASRAPPLPTSRATPKSFLVGDCEGGTDPRTPAEEQVRREDGEGRGSPFLWEGLLLFPEALTSLSAGKAPSGPEHTRGAGAPLFLCPQVPALAGAQRRT